MRIEQLHEGMRRADPIDKGNPAKDSGIDQSKYRGSNLPAADIDIKPVDIKGKNVDHSVKSTTPAGDKPKSKQKQVQNATDRKAILKKKDKKKMVDAVKDNSTQKEG